MNKEEFKALLDALIVKMNEKKDAKAAAEYLTYPRLREICAELGMELTPKDFKDCIRIELNE
jgi:hypothetical protein